MKVYIVTTGCYSDYEIDRVFMSKERAEKYCSLRNKPNCPHDQEDYRIEEYEADDEREIEIITAVRITYIHSTNTIRLHHFIELKSILEPSAELHNYFHKIYDWENDMNNNSLGYELVPNDSLIWTFEARGTQLEHLDEPKWFLKLAQDKYAELLAREEDL